ncbi:DsrE family protein [Thiohalorhabdus sp. Cl-TMA]|uniref:DsrE family protein n=1 Tax=Thiohalorhabdus methylotrophus TaxID=3242694 RepID=A0ABV4TRF3_9GAMM
MADDSSVSSRRQFLAAAGSVVGGVGLVPAARASEGGLSFPGEDPEIRIVFQINRDDPEYYDRILFSMGEILRQLDNRAELVGVGFGPGLNLLLKDPPATVRSDHGDKVSSLMTYGVGLRACENTMQALDATGDDLRDGVKTVPAGVLEMAELQQKGFSYVAW